MSLEAESPQALLYAVSDGTGETALHIIRAVKAQFSNSHVRVQKFSKISDRTHLEEVLILAKEKHAMIIASLVDPELRVFLVSRAMQLGVQVVDILFPLLESLSRELGQRPQATPGLLRQLNESYFSRIQAIEYTVRHDDGLAHQDLGEADIVLIGVSRTSKTPLSMYLGHKGYKVANIPLIAHVTPPQALFTIDQNKVIALTIDPDRLTEIRQARLAFLRGQEHKEEIGAYADSQHVFEEIEWSRELFQKNRRWPVIDVTGKALEENATEIERIILERFPQLEA